ncbi:MAG TPA: MerR family transcriptional regulator [Trebonia sp.]|nr:MerR family transcriptional regulator [Trebonia sp.]
MAAQAPEPDGSPTPGNAWTAGQVARHLGISESTLRTWHRRYGLDPHDAEPGRYRRYQAADVARLDRMLGLINEGMLASEAALAVQSGEPAFRSPERDTADLLAAAQALDTQRCARLLDGAFDRHGVIAAWQGICRPALAAVDAIGRRDPYSINVEHCLSWAMQTALSRVSPLPAVGGAARILLACAEDEQHTLSLAALAAALAERQVPTRMLGAAVPMPSLVRAVRETGPETVVLWSQQPQTARRDELRALRALPVRLVIAGPGWPTRTKPGAHHVATLSEAVALLAP